MKSQAVDFAAREIFGKIGSEKLRRVATNCLYSTLETTITWSEGHEPFVITGDIPAMWLRDSSCQLEPFVRFTQEDSALQSLISGVIRRQAMYIQLDPYANAFNETASGVEGFPKDKTEKNPWVYERKFELDSLCHPVRLWRMYWEVTHDPSMFTKEFKEAIERILTVFETEQNHDVLSAYRFERGDCPPTDTLVRGGRGAEVGQTGLIWSGFRPSDDACTHHYLVPSELFAYVTLRYLKELVVVGYQDASTLQRIDRLSETLGEGLNLHTTITHPRHGDIWAYEVNGLGGFNLMDDPNVPSLLSLPYLGVCDVRNPQYLRTRNFVLSPDNPYFVSGTFGSALASPHTPKGYFWPIAVVMQALTSTSDDEVRSCIDLLVKTDADTGYMHESIDIDNPKNYTRPWFAWANSLFAELMLRQLGAPEVLARGDINLAAK
jgi:uncharacterized protein